MPRYLPLSITVSTGIRGYLERGDFMAGITVLAIQKPCCSAVSSRSQGEKGLGSFPQSWDVSRGWARDFLSPRGGV